MDKRVIFNRNYGTSCLITRVKFGEKGSVPIDQSLSMSFNIDPSTGRPMSDVQRLVKMQNEVQLQASFAQLNDFKSEFIPEGVSDADALKFMCPRLSQLPSELLAYKDGLAKYQLDKQLKAEQAAQAKKEEEERNAYLESFRQDLVDSSKKD